VSALHAVRVEIDYETASVSRLLIFFPNYIAASDYALNLDSTVNIALTPTPANGDLSTVLVGNRIFNGGIAPIPSNAIAILLPLSFVELFANVFSNSVVYFRPIQSYLTNLDGSSVSVSLNPLPIDALFYGLAFPFLAPAF